MKTTSENPTHGGSQSGSSACPAFSVGAWFLMDYGCERLKFYIAEVRRGQFRLSRRNWLASAGVWMTRRDMEHPMHNAAYVGHGRAKWYWRWLPWRDCCVPFHEPRCARGSGPPCPFCGFEPLDELSACFHAAECWPTQSGDDGRIGAGLGNVKVDARPDGRALKQEREGNQ